MAQPKQPATGLPPTIDPAESLEFILQLADAERRLRNSTQWKTDVEAAFGDHSEAVEDLYDELYRLLDLRIHIGDPVPKRRMPPDPRKELKSQIVARLKEELPSMVASIIDEF